MTALSLRRRAILAMLAAVFVGLLFTAAPAPAKSPTIPLPVPPVVPPINLPPQVVDALKTAAPTTGAACRAVAIAAYDEELVRTLALPQVAGQLGLPPVPTIQNVTDYLALLQQPCAALPLSTTISQCASDDQLSATLASMTNTLLAQAAGVSPQAGQLGIVAGLVGLPLPRVGVLVDQIIAIEGAASKVSGGAAPSTLGAVLYNQLHCHDSTTPNDSPTARVPSRGPVNSSPSPSLSPAEYKLALPGFPVVAPSAAVAENFTSVAPPAPAAKAVDAVKWSFVRVALAVLVGALMVLLASNGARRARPL